MSERYHPSYSFAHLLAARLMNRSTISHDTPVPAPDSLPHGRVELIAVLVLCLIAAGLRVAFPSRMAVEHFDEGVYASNLLCPDAGYRYPDWQLYAPSLQPALIEWSIIAFGTANWVPMLPSLVFGTLTIPLLWWVGRSWFGPAAGLAAATLAALSDYHILFSRSALTDVTLGFWLLLAVFFFENAFRTLNPARAVIAGVVTGLAWWTKYNGWLPLAISLSGLAAWSLFTPRDERRFGRRLFLWGLAAVIALAAWSPYWWSLPHGYAEIAQNHRQYFVGFAGWREGFVRHLECQLFGVRGATGSSLIAVLVLVLIDNSPRHSRIWFGRDAHQPPAPPVPAGFRRSQSEWLLATWLVGLTLTTPLYHPYPRLVFPWMMAAWLGLAWLFFGASRFENLSILPRKIRGVIWSVVLLVSATVPQFVDVPLPRENLWLSGWQSRTALANLAQQVQKAIRREVSLRGAREVGGKRAIVYVFAEPGLFFHLPAADLAVGPVGDLRFANPTLPAENLPIFLVTGPHADRMTDFHDAFAKSADRLELVQRWPYAASDFVLLDQVPPAELTAERAKLEVRLFRVK